MNKHVTVLNLDDDLRDELAPFLWISELKSGKFALWEQDMYASMVTLANTVQAQRVALRAAREIITGLYIYEREERDYQHAYAAAGEWLEDVDDDATTRG
jgi:hypothetical protein